MDLQKVSILPWNQIKKHLTDLEIETLHPIQKATLCSLYPFTLYKKGKPLYGSETMRESIWYMARGLCFIFSTGQTEIYEAIQVKTPDKDSIRKGLDIIEASIPLKEEIIDRDMILLCKHGEKKIARLVFKFLPGIIKFFLDEKEDHDTMFLLDDDEKPKYIEGRQ